MNIQLTLPWPVSENQYRRAIVRGRYAQNIISAKGRDYQAAVRKALAGLPSAVRAMLPLQEKLSLSIDFYRPDKHRRDLDNLLKCLFDSLTQGGFWADDSLAYVLNVRWANDDDEPCKPGFCKLTVYPLVGQWLISDNNQIIHTTANL